jgi:SAM-dependent methyltransferase
VSDSNLFSSLLTKAFVALLRFPGARKRLWHGWYDFLARSYRDRGWTFMNYGFHDGSTANLSLQESDEKDRSCIQLYNYGAAAVELSDRRVLEVGSGRGGGCSFIARYFKPSQMTGCDLSVQSIEFCKSTHRLSGLYFQVGDAEKLPFADGTFDAVVNVESSHCYPSLDRFFGEVHRVLSAGGHFLYADLHERRSLEQWRERVCHSGLRIIRETDITREVVAALDLDNQRKLALIDQKVPRLLRPSFYDFAGILGSKIDQGFRSGTLAYVSLVAEKRVPQGIST